MDPAIESTPVMDEARRQRARELTLTQLRPPRHVPGYEQERFLGRGAFGEVWVATDSNNGRKVAIKYYHRRGGLDWSLLSREVEKLRYLFGDRHVVQLLQVGWDSDPPYYVMEYMENGSLEDVLRETPLPVDRAMEMFHGIATGLVHAHGKGILHCDLKPANVMLDQDGQPRLADFGQSRLSHEHSPALGTLFYMAPEQADMKAVVADFLGDAALGFWGWPLADPAMVRRACLAAIGIRRHYETHSDQAGDPLAGFRVGIGIATGRAVAGRVGPNEQAKVTVFGPVVNLAARLESMTKLLHVPILIDEPTARVVRDSIGPADARVRRLAMVRPYGLDTPLVVSELLPPEGPGTLTSVDVANYEKALDAFLAGDWNAAFETLHLVSPRDRGKDILTGHIIAHNHTPPAGWSGVIDLVQK